MSLVVHVHADRRAAELRAADEIATLLKQKPGAVLGMPTGASPVGVYTELVRRHREDGLSWRAATVVLLDEYWPLDAGHPASFRRYLATRLVEHVDLPAGSVLALDGTVAEADVEAACARLESTLAERGGLDFVLLGIGRTGHLAFNEPGSPAASRTRRVALHPTTRADAAAAFAGPDEVPAHGLTLGLGTILSARRVRLLAFGASKASVVARAVEGPPTEQLPASLLHDHPDAAFLLDAAAASALVPRRA